MNALSIRLSALSLLLAITLSAFAVEAGQVRYVSGTITTIKEDAIGKLDYVSEKALTFDSPAAKLVIPYAAIQSYEYSREVTYHLGVAPAIAVGLVKRRKRQHFFRISYRDENNMLQVAVFEVPKQTPQVLLAVLQARAPQGCKAADYARCGSGRSY